jgi:hypothetical protein
MATTRWNNPLLGNRSVSTFRWQWIKENNRETVLDGDLYSGGLEIILVKRAFVRQSSRVKAGSNTSTVALRVVGGDGKGTKCLEL